MTYLIQFTRQFTGVKEGPTEFAPQPLILEDATDDLLHAIIAKNFEESQEIKGAMVYISDRQNKKLGISSYRLLFYILNPGYDGTKLNAKQNSKIVEVNITGS